MGCVSSQPRTRIRNVWDVMNVDELGNRMTPGRLEITRTDLILHQKGKPCVHWPLKCLRRYGFDTELFSFESGRRCTTGAGVFAFKCRKSFEIFNMLHGYLRSEQANSLLAANGTGGNHLSVGRPRPPVPDVPPPLPPPPVGGLGSAGLNISNGGTVPANATTLVARRRHGAFVPTLPQDMLDNWVASTEPPLSPPPFSDVVTPTYQNFPAGPSYMNVFVTSHPRDSLDSGLMGGPHYVNVDNQSRRSRQSSDSSAETPQQGINYVELDLERNSDSGAEHNQSRSGSQVGSGEQQREIQDPGASASAGASASSMTGVAAAISPGAVNGGSVGASAGASAGPGAGASSSSSLQPRSYATIDFEKTAALSTFTSAVPDDSDPSTRKTRHDTTCPVPRTSLSNE